MLMFNSILRYFMMIYLSITTGCCLVLNEAIVNPEYADALHTTLSTIMLIVFILLTFPLTAIVLRNSKKKKLLDPNFR